MEAPSHTLSNLFAQLGLSGEAQAIAAFIQNHRPLPSALALPDAPFWTLAQAAFLREEMLNDADWAEVIDQLNTELHADM